MTSNRSGATALSVSDNGGLGDRQMTFEGNKTDRSPMITIEIDLTNPKDLMEKMELIDLTDEETDALLDKAMSINKQLKEELKRRENLEQTSRSFVVSAPASCQQQRILSGRKLQPSNMPSMGYRDQQHHQSNAMARLNSGKVPALDRSRTDTNSLMGNPYSYHSARPVRSLGLQSSNQSTSQEQKDLHMNDY